MKTFKFIGLSVAFVVCIGYVAAKEVPVSKKSEIMQLQNILQHADLGQYVKTDTKLQVSFIVNNNNEILVTSTNNTGLDHVIKNALNYHKITLVSLKKNKIYTLPVSIRFGKDQ